MTIPNEENAAHSLPPIRIIDIGYAFAGLINPHPKAREAWSIRLSRIGGCTYPRTNRRIRKEVQARTAGNKITWNTK